MRSSCRGRPGFSFRSVRQLCSAIYDGPRKGKGRTTAGVVASGRVGIHSPSWGGNVRIDKPTHHCCLFLHICQKITLHTNQLVNPRLSTHWLSPSICSPWSSSRVLPLSDTSAATLARCGFFMFLARDDLFTSCRGGARASAWAKLPNSSRRRRSCSSTLYSPLMNCLRFMSSQPVHQHSYLPRH